MKAKESRLIGVHPRKSAFHLYPRIFLDEREDQALENNDAGAAQAILLKLEGARLI